MRHLWNLRFAQLTVFVTLNAAVFVALFGAESRLPELGHLIVPAAAIVIDLCLLVVDYRIRGYYSSTRKRAAELEHSLGFRQYGYLPRRGVLTTANAFSVTYLVFVAAWILVLLNIFVPSTAATANLQRNTSATQTQSFSVPNSGASSTSPTP
jgi:hypothetical protein